MKYNQGMLRWSLWSVELRQTVPRKTRSRILRMWLVNGGIMMAGQVLVLAAVAIIAIDVLVALLVRAAMPAMDGPGFLWSLAGVSVLILHQVMVRYVRSELRDEAARQGIPQKTMPQACPACGYDLRGNPAGSCPECGFGSDGPN